MLSISFFIHFLFQSLYFLIYAPGYANAINSYDKYRINHGVKRAWEDNPDWPKTKRRLFYYLGINYIIVYPAMIILSTAISGIKVRF